MTHLSRLVSIAAMMALGAQAGAAPAETVVIGCLARDGQSAYLLKDRRSGAPFRILANAQSPAQTLEWQVGHELEIHGTVDAASGSPQTLAAGTVLTIATRCQASGGPTP
jgi:UDP-glucose 4-epimerase